MKFELHGKNKDVIEFKNKVGNFNENHGREKYNHIELNNEVTKRREDGFFSLEKRPRSFSSLFRRSKR